MNPSTTPLVWFPLVLALPLWAQAESRTSPSPAHVVADRLGLEFAVFASQLRRNVVSSADPHGFAIARVLPGSPADLASLRAGQVVMKIDGKPFRELRDLEAAILALPLDAPLRLGCSRPKATTSLLDRRPWEDFEISLLPAQELVPAPGAPPDAIVLAKVARVHGSPGVWCGIVVTRQEVTYRIDRLLFGKATPRELRLAHLLVAKSALVMTEVPALDPERFWPGAPVVLRLREQSGTWELVGDDRGLAFVLPPRTLESSTAELLKLLVEQPGLQTYLHLDERELVIALNEAIPAPSTLMVGSKRAKFVPEDLLKREAFLRLDSVRRDGTSTHLRFSLPAEGVVGTLTATPTRDGWRVDRFEAVEK